MVHFKSIFKMGAILLLIVCGFMLIPLWLSVYYGEPDAFKGFAVTMCAATGLSIPYLIYTYKYKSLDLDIRDGFFFVTFSWISMALVGALPYFLSGAIPNFTDAFFESMSGFSTTGATILSDIEALPKSMLFWRALTHWIGGMGIVVLTVAVFPLMGIGGLQLIQAEAPGLTVDRLTPRIAETAKILWLIYVAFTAIETILLILGDMDIFDAVTHAFSTISTGGLSTRNASIGDFKSPYIETVVTVFMFLSGINFALHYRLLAKSSSSVFKDEELRVFLGIILIAAALVTADLYLNHYHSIGQSLSSAFFQVTAVITTTGFTAEDYTLWPSLSQVVLLCLFFVGACSGSTSGGIKVIRIVILFKQAINEIKLLLHPRGVFVLKINDAVVKKNIVYAAAGFFFIYIAIVLIVTFITASSGTDIFASFCAALASLGCIGPGFGGIGPSESYGFFRDYVKWTLSFAMLIGRLEIYTVMVLFTPWFWKR